MKKIFDWLREQVNDGREFEHDERNECFNNALDYAIRRVDEAEAKWEADCCEWKYDKGSDISYPHYATTCGNSVKNICSGHTYCGYCGKPIKIVEVE